MIISKKHRILLITAIVAGFLVSCAPPHYRRGGVSYGSRSRRSIVYTARRYLGVRYRWGGTSPRGFDCSGYVMYVYRKNGIRIPRTAGMQYQRGRKITSRYLRPGDLVFFQTSRRRISHVGIYAGRGRFIHAPKRGKNVSYASLRNRYWRRKYRGAVTYL